MKTENVVLMRMARESLKGKWGLAIGTFVIYMLISASISGIAQFFPLAGILSLLITQILMDSSYFMVQILWRLQRVR